MYDSYKNLKTKAGWFYPIERLNHYGVTPENAQDYLPCKLKSIRGSWHLIFTDGYDWDTQYSSRKSNGFHKSEMIKDFSL